jgi:hypothetical protein
MRGLKPTYMAELCFFCGDLINMLAEERKLSPNPSPRRTIPFLMTRRFSERTTMTAMIQPQSVTHDQIGVYVQCSDYCGLRIYDGDQDHAAGCGAPPEEKARILQSLSGQCER